MRADLEGLTIFSVIDGFLLLPIHRIKESSFMGQENCIHYRRNHVASGSGVAGFDWNKPCHNYHYTMSIVQRKKIHQQGVLTNLLLLFSPPLPPPPPPAFPPRSWESVI